MGQRRHAERRWTHRLGDFPDLTSGIVRPPGSLGFPGAAPHGEPAGVRFFEGMDSQLPFDLVAQKYHAVFERGGLDQLQVLPILENAPSLAA